jgi:hypothetical protein
MNCFRYYDSFKADMNRVWGVPPVSYDGKPKLIPAFFSIFFFPGFFIADAALGTDVVNGSFAVDFHDENSVTPGAFNRLHQGMFTASGAVQNQGALGRSRRDVHILQIDDMIVNYCIAGGAFEWDTIINFSVFIEGENAIFVNGDHAEKDNDHR